MDELDENYTFKPRIINYTKSMTSIDKQSYYDKPVTVRLMDKKKDKDQKLHEMKK